VAQQGPWLMVGSRPALAMVVACAPR
jgi:hypothetical protein